MTTNDRDTYRAYVTAAIALAATLDVIDKIATDPTYAGDRGAEADARRERMLADDLERYRTACEAFLREVTTK